MKTYVNLVGQSLIATATFSLATVVLLGDMPISAIRRFEFTYVTRISNISTAGSRVRVWIPSLEPTNTRP